MSGSLMCQSSCQGVAPSTFGRLEQDRVQALEAGQDHDHGVADQTPRQHEDQGDDRRVLVFHHVDGVVAECLEDHIEQAQVAVEEPAPQEGRDHHGDDPGNQAEHLDEVGEQAVFPVHPERQEQADADRQECGDDGDLKREQEGLADADVFQKPQIVAEADKVALYQIVQIIKAAIERIKERDDQQEDEHEHGRCHISHGSELCAFFFPFHKFCPPHGCPFQGKC